MNIDYTWLENNFFGRKLSESQKKLIIDKFEVEIFEKDEAIVTQGDAGNIIYIFHSGSACIDCLCNGENINVGNPNAGDLVGEMSFLTDADACATVTAKEACTVYKLSRRSFSAIMKNDHELAYSILAHLLNHTATAVRHMNAEKVVMQHYITGARF